MPTYAGINIKEDPDLIIKRGVDNLDNSLSRFVRLSCPVACAKEACKIAEFQSLCKDHCSDFVKDDTYKTCLAQASTPIPPAHILTEALKGGARGTYVGGAFGGGAGIGISAYLLGSSEVGQLTAIPGAAAGGAVGTGIGVLVGAARAAFDTAFLTVCQVGCSEQNCKHPMVKSTCQKICVGKFESFISNCKKAVSKPSE